jgi:hypothetical protein
MTDFETLKSIFSRPVCQRATQPLKVGVEIAVILPGGKPTRLRRTAEGTVTEDCPASAADMTFDVPTAALQKLESLSTEDIGEIGVEILKLMASQDANTRIKARVHIGAFTLFTNGYLGILPLGGPTVMKFLGTKGLTSLGKIKDALSKLKG